MKIGHIKEEFLNPGLIQKYEPKDEKSLYKLCEGKYFRRDCLSLYTPNPWETLRYALTPRRASFPDISLSKLGTGKRILSQPPTFEPGMFYRTLPSRGHKRSKKELKSN